MRIAQEKICRVHQRVILFLCFHLETPQRGLRKRIVDRAPFVGIVAHCAVFEVFLDQQYLRPAPLEAHDACPSQLPAVQSNVIRTDPRRKPALVKKFAAPLVNFQPQFSLLRIPVEIEVTGQFLRPRSFLRDRGRLRRFRPRPNAHRRRKRRTRQQNAGPSLRHVPSLQTCRMVLQQK